MNKWENISVQLSGEILKDSEYIPLQAEESIDTVQVKEAVELFRSIVFTGYFRQEPVSYLIYRFASILARQISIAIKEEAGTRGEETPCDCEDRGICIAEKIVKMLPELKATLGTDVKAVYDGDPAARSYREVILCYPAIVAISSYRLAHAILECGVPLIPRIMTEQSHSRTGIDIHPGAVIGNYFSIDHGTGVVIGETSIIGNHVRLYQGVTLGAKSFKYDAQGLPVNEPRHPVLEDNVTVYSNASILGRITIGHDSVIGGNIWQTVSVPPYSRVLQGRPTVTFEDGAGI